MAQTNLECLGQRYNNLSLFNRKWTNFLKVFTFKIPKISFPDIPKLSIENLEEYWKTTQEKLKTTFYFQLPKIPSFCDGLPATSDSKKPTINLAAEVMAGPSVNNSTITAAGEFQTKQNIEAAKSQSLNEMTKVMNDLNDSFNEKGIVETREYIRLFQNYLPVNEYTKKLSFFQPISESVGSSFFASTRDKPSLAIEDWKNGQAETIRGNLKYKLSIPTQTAIQNAYTSLNKRFANHVSNEFLASQSAPENVAHGYHLAGDKIWYKNHVNPTRPLMISLSTNLFSVLGDQAFLVNYLYPIEENLTIENTIYEIESEGKSLAIDQKGNLVENIIGTANQTLQPSQPVES